MVNFVLMQGSCFICSNFRNLKKKKIPSKLESQPLKACIKYKFGRVHEEQHMSQRER